VQVANGSQIISPLGSGLLPIPPSKPDPGGVLKGEITIGKAPAFQLYASDFYMDTAGWTATQVGVYARLLMYEWVNGPIPSDMASLSRIAGISDTRTMYKMWSGTMGKKFISNGGNLLFNKRLEEEREKQAKHREIQVEKGISGAKKRWKNHITPAIAQAQPEDSSSSSSSSSTLKKESIFHSETKLFLTFYAKQFNHEFDTDPVIEWGKDGKIIKGLLKFIPFDQLKDLLIRFFSSEDKFIQKSGYTIGVFKSQLNKLKIGNHDSFGGEKLWLRLQEEQDEKNRQKAVSHGLIENKGLTSGDESES
jgi:uncharacterized protein YdaU (DUF1376 family)